MPRADIPVSTIHDVIDFVTATFSAIGDATPIQTGAQFLAEFGPGQPPRVVFVPDKQASLGPASRIGAGAIAAWHHGCKVVVLAAESGIDAGRGDAAYRLAGRVIAALKKASPAFVTLADGAGPVDDSSLPAEGYGYRLEFAFRFERPIPQDQEILRAQVEAVSPRNPDQPGGDSGKTFAVAVSAAPISLEPSS